MAPVDESFKLVSRTVQWRINVPFSSYTTKSFKLGNLTWNIVLGWNPRPQCHRNVNFFLPATNDLDRNTFIHVDYILRVAGDNRTWPWSGKVHSGWLRRGRDGMHYSLGDVIGKRLVIELEFLRMMTCHLNGEELVPEWPTVGPLRDKEATNDPLNCLSRMFTESVHTDVIIITKSGSLRAHKAVLAASSPVFARMLDNDFKEKISSTVHLGDMSLESCTAFLKYLYGNLREEELRSHRIALLEAAHKYGIVNLQKLCEESLLEDITSESVLERLCLSHLYELKNLKQGCLTYLFDFQKVTAMREAFISFLLDTDTDRELAKELIEMMLPVPK